jgi:hypothetical protein
MNSILQCEHVPYISFYPKKKCLIYFFIFHRVYISSSELSARLPLHHGIYSPRVTFIFMVRPRKIEKLGEPQEKLFVGNLPCDATEEEIFNVFATFGNIVEIHCLGSYGSRSGQACAFVRFHDIEAAKNAVNQLHGKVALRPWQDPVTPLQVRPARSHCHAEGSYTSQYGESQSSPCSENIMRMGWVKLFIGNLPKDTTAIELNLFLLTLNIPIIEAETIVLNGRVSSHQSVCAFVFVTSLHEANYAISVLDGKQQLRPSSFLLRASVAHVRQGPQPAESMKPRGYSDSAIPHPMAYGTGTFLLPTPIAMGWDDSAYRTYQHYMFMPQSPHYGPMNITPGKEPWISGGIYSLPRASFTQPYIGQ